MERGPEVDLDERMDPEVAAALPSVPVLDLEDIQGARRARIELMEMARDRWSPDPNVLREDRMVHGDVGQPDVRVRVYRPAAPAKPSACLFWIHGGGHVVGQVEQDDPLMDQIVGATGCVAVSVDWRRPPEHPFPAPMDDCYAGLRWTYEHARELRVDASRLVVGGSSSGAGSAAGLTLLARDRGEVPISFQFLIYPMLDDRNVTPSSFAITDRRVWNRASNLIAWRAYLGAAFGTDDVSAYAAPARAEDLSGLPPAFIAVGDLDLFIDEDLEYAQRLIHAGVPTELHVYPRAIHGFDLFAPDAELSKRYMAVRDEVLHRVLST